MNPPSIPNFIIKPKMVTDLLSPDFGFPSTIDLPLAVPRFPKPADPNPSVFNPLSDRDFTPEGLNTKDILDDIKDGIKKDNIDDIKLLISDSYRIALIDTGVNKDHHDFTRNTITLLSANGDDEDIKDQYGHGTHIAGILSGNGDGKDTIQGMVPGAPIISYKITRKKSSETRWTNVVNALDQVISYNEDHKDKKISVVNLSFNGFDNLIGDEGMGEHKLYKKIMQLHKDNIPVVVSGGNYFDQFFVKTDGANQKLKEWKQSYGLAYPANFKYVIACGASCPMGRPVEGRYEMLERELAPFTQRIADGMMQGGSHDLPEGKKESSLSSERIFVTAPAIATYSTGLKQGYTSMCGSSMAAPVITGIVFLLQLYAKSRHLFSGHLPDISFIKEALRKGSKPDRNTRESEFSKHIKNEYAQCFDGREYLHVNAKEILKEFKNLTQSSPHH